MDRKIILLGDMGEKYGREWVCGESNISDALKLIECQTEGFKQYIIGALEAGLEAAIMVGSEIIDDEIQISNISNNDIYISLIPAGSKGFGKILAGIAIALFAFYFAIPAGAATSVGGSATVPISQFGFAAGGFIQTGLYALAANLAIAGVTELLTKLPKTAAAEVDGKIFNGPGNSTKQGQPLPLLYGQLLVGGAPISIDFTAGSIPESIPSFVTNFGITTASGGGAVDTTTDEVIITVPQGGSSVDNGGGGSDGGSSGGGGGRVTPDRGKRLN